VAQESIKLQSHFTRLGVKIDDDAVSLLSQYVALLVAWNKKLNLISRRDMEFVWERHIAHSLSILAKVQLPRHARVLDLGTGGGLPGIPVKIVRPDLAVTLLDSTKKKIAAVESMLSTLGLRQIEAVWGRAEELGPTLDSHEKYRFVISRGVASLGDLAKWSAPFLATGHPRGRGADEGLHSALVALKGGPLEAEVHALQLARQVESVRVINLTADDLPAEGFIDKKIVVVTFYPPAHRPSAV